MIDPNAPTLTQEPLAMLSVESKQLVRESLSPNLIDVLRSSIYEKRTKEYEAILNTPNKISFDELIQDTHNADKTILEDEIKTYLYNLGLSDLDVSYSYIYGLLEHYSPMNMSESEWEYGILNNNGEYEAGTSGKERIKTDTKALIGELTDEDETANTELDTLQVDLEVKRAALADLSIKRRGMVLKKSKKASRLRAQYEAAQAEYNTAYTNLGATAVDLMRLSGASAQEVAQAVIAGTIAEHFAFSTAELESMQSDNSLKAKVARYYGKLPVMIGANTVLGGLLGYGARKIAKVGFLVALPVAGVAGLAAIRAGKTMLTSSLVSGIRLNKDHQKRSQKDIEDLQSLFNSPDVNVPEDDDMDANQYGELSHRLIKQSIDSRVEKDVTNNRKRVAFSAAIAGSAAVVGAILASHIHLGSGGGSHNNQHLDHRPTSKTPDEILREAGVKDPTMRKDIINNPKAFQTMAENPERFRHFMEGVQQPHSLPLYNPENGIVYESFTIPHGGGIIKDVIRPIAVGEGHGLTTAQENQLWQAMRVKFGNALFTNLVVGNHGNDQWILQSGQGTLRPEVARYLKEQIALMR